MFVVACVILLALPACDGAGSDTSDESPGGGSSQMTKAEFIERVDAICASTNPLEGVDPPKNLSEGARFLRRLLPVIRAQLDRIRAVGQPPEEDAATYLEWFEARDGIVETTADMIEAAEEGDAAQFGRLALLQQELDADADEAARAYGFEVCGGSGGPAG